jgi:alpha-ketoglutarate-dependent taurine dioxygenase
MSTQERNPVAFRPKRRAGVSLSSDALVSSAELLPGGPIPLLLSPNVDGVNLPSWVAANRDMIRERLLAHAAVLFRGFAVHGVAEFEQIMQLIGGDLIEYSYGSTPRNHVAGNVYTSTEYPADQHIPLHNELSYSRVWPMKLGFYSITSAPEGGETPLADSRRVLERIPARIRDRFDRKQIMYVRNYRQGIDLSWQDVFRTTDRVEVEEFCGRSGIEFEWTAEEGLRTRQVCPSLATHPVTNETVWFNQSHLFHISNLADDLRDTMLRTFGEDGLPRNTYYGDGSPIDPADLDVIRRVYREESIAFRWQDGDIAMLENLLVAHGRRPFCGPRKLVVGMAEPSDRRDG